MPTGISYADEVWNVCIGCTKIASGCENCWAERLHDMRHKAWFAKLSDWTTCPKQYWKPFSKIQLLPDRLEQPLHWRKPRTIFVNSMGDTFHEDVPFEFIDDIMSIVCQRPDHTFMFFTKRWARALEYYNSANAATQHVMRDYVHLYCSCSIQQDVDKALPILMNIPVEVRGLSIEPLIGPVHLPPGRNLRSVIIGAESGPNRRPCETEWIGSLVKQCSETGVDCYVKQIEIDGKVCGDPKKFPENLRVRSMPK